MILMLDQRGVTKNTIIVKDQNALLKCQEELNQDYQFGSTRSISLAIVNEALTGHACKRRSNLPLLCMLHNNALQITIAEDIIENLKFDNSRYVLSRLYPDFSYFALRVYPNVDFQEMVAWSKAGNTNKVIPLQAEANTKILTLAKKLNEKK